LGHTPSYETVCQWANAVRNGWEEKDGAPHSAAPISAMDERLTEQVKIVLEHMCSISRKATATGQNLQQLFTISSPTAWGNEKFV